MSGAYIKKANFTVSTKSNTLCRVHGWERPVGQWAQPSPWTGCKGVEDGLTVERKSARLTRPHARRTPGAPQLPPAPAARWSPPPARRRTMWARLGTTGARPGKRIGGRGGAVRERSCLSSPSIHPLDTTASPALFCTPAPPPPSAAPSPPPPPPHLVVQLVEQ